ncbi:helix-turn-helix domain-containing protein [Novosphingobium lindaniclasticum]|uniref:helix-turn-helix domain-containing protein n=1 Tax=Novosphingobium lindaniclasticum TaxID=1329895 RepID=UPI0009DB7AFD|nr:helix-turn-helix transcriptional regulator [Novosphingobium lindaniclasticum]
MQRGWVVSPDYRTLISTLSSIRKELKISQRELARRVGKPPSFINKIELLERRLDIQEFIVIAEALDCEPGTLLNILRDNLEKELSL